MQLRGSFVQSVLHLNLSHDIQPIGGVLARPLSRPVTCSRLLKRKSVQALKVQKFILLVCPQKNENKYLKGLVKVQLLTEVNFPFSILV